MGLKKEAFRGSGFVSLIRRGAIGVALLGVALLCVGCGSGGYAGDALQSLSASRITIDAGQSFSVSETGTGNLQVSWALTGNCSGSACGTLSTGTGTSTTYTAPAPLSAPMQVTLTANVTGTASAKSVAITVNPAPAINGTTPNGTVGIAYSATLVTSGGTGSIKLSQTAGTLPAGLSFNAATGVISGTPTQTGTASLTFQAVDSSDVPYTVTATRTITIGTAALPLTASGAPPAGVVGMPYRTALQASGGTAPYTWTVASGALPAGLTLSLAGIVAGTPTAAGTSTFTAQVQDAAGARATVTSTIAVTSAQTPVTVATGTLPTGTVGAPYTGTVGGSGGTGPYTCGINTGTLPAGLTLGANCVVSGTPSSPGTTTITVGITDSGNPPSSGSGPVSITVNPVALSISAGTLPNGTVGTPYTSTLGVAGGTAPYTCSVVSGTLPAGLVFTSGCTVSGTPTVAGTSTPTIRATDSSNPAQSTTRPVSITISAAPANLTVSSPPAGTVNQPYTGTVPVSGGTGPYTCTLSGGTLPAGFTLNANCQITGTPTTTGSTTATVTATDSSNPPNSGSGPITVTINPGVTTLSLGVPPTATVNVPYTGTVPVSGGTGPYTCTQTSGTLPAGLTLNANCQITGTPTTPGTTTVTVTATDSSNPAKTGSSTVPVTVNPAAATLTFGTPAQGTVNTPYTGTVPVSGGTSPYTCQQVGGALPAGLTLNGNCSITGTPTAAGTANVTVKATDAASPANTDTANIPVTINPAGATLSVGTPPNATVNTPYTGTVPVSGGTAPYTCQQTGGTLPAGLTLGNNCQITGTPTTPGTTTVTVTVTDGANPANTTTANVPITVNPATVTLTFGNPPAATVNTPYTGTVPVSGGTAPYTCTLAGGTLPAGLTLGANCQVTGTPTAVGSATVSVSATDSGNPATTNTGNVTVTVNPAPVTLVIAGPPAATVNTPYTGTVPVSGGTAPYTCQQTGGTLPAGLALNNNCQITGTPTTAGTTNVTVKATDAASPANTTTASVPVTVNPAGSTTTLAIGNPPAATVNTPYTGTVPVTGGTAPYSCTLAGGTLPAGLTLGATCQVTGTPTATGTSTVSITATDSANHITTGPSTITANPVPALTFTGSLPNGVVNQPYAQTLAATGGVGPYTYALTSGALPAGLTLSPGGVVSGTPTAVGASSFTVTATDSEGTPQTASLPLVLLITYQTTASDALLKGLYAFLFQGYDDMVAGVLAYQTATVGSFTADGTGVLSAGEQDSNHQTSNPTGNTVPTRSSVGTYTVGTDGRGFITTTTFNTNGTVDETVTYAIALKAPTAPATAASKGSLIRYDGNQLVGTKGSGTLLLQTPTAFTAGLNGSYAYGVQGDTPCLPTCTANLSAGPAVGVGQFNAAGGAITGGTADTNVAATNFANSTLGGTAAAADTNGRVQLMLTNSGLTGTFYPTDYAAYIVDSNNVLLMSTDKHSAFILQAGTARLQTQATFSNASLGAPFVGYENSPVNPGLVGQTLQNVLNLSTATVFQTNGLGNGTCTTNHVDVGGTTGLVNTLTGLGGTIPIPIVSQVLGTYSATGNSNCTVAGNGRATFNYPQQTGLLGLPIGTPPPPRTVYLVSPETGYFLETGYAGLGMIEAQTGNPFTLATLNGTYVYGTIPQSTLATTNASGTFTADGQGNATRTRDENVGVGTLNVLQLGVTQTGTYTLTDAAAGRFQIGATPVIYAISPGRFALLEADPTSTTPYIALLY